MIGHLKQIIGTMVDRETGLRGYLLSGDDAFLEPFTAGKAQMDAIRSLVDDFVAMETGLPAEREQGLQASLDNGQTVITAATTAAFVLIVLMLLFLIRR